PAPGAFTLGAPTGKRQGAIPPRSRVSPAVLVGPRARLRSAGVLCGLGPLPGVRWALARDSALAAGGVILLLATTGQLANARNGFAATLVILTGVVLATAPIWRRLLDSRAQERTARVRSEERAAVAAHLHDSVLQTLALIQRH